jgi:hypothetical protein
MDLPLSACANVSRSVEKVGARLKPLEKSGGRGLGPTGSGLAAARPQALVEKIPHGVDERLDERDSAANHEIASHDVHDGERDADVHESESGGLDHGGAPAGSAYRAARARQSHLQMEPIADADRDVREPSKSGRNRWLHHLQAGNRYA